MPEVAVGQLKQAVENIHGAVLRTERINSPLEAVRAAIVAERRAAT